MPIRRLLISIVLVAASSISWADQLSVEKLPVVTDSLGVVVGNTADGEFALRRVGTQIASLFIDPLAPYEGTIIFFHVEPDCSGQRYLISSTRRMFLPVELGRDPLTEQPVSFIGNGSIVTLEIAAQENIEPECETNGGLPLANGYCCISSPRVDLVRSAQPIVLPVFTPPISAH